MTPEEVREAAAAWVYVPPDAREVRTEEFHLIAYPAHWAEATSVFRLASARPAAELVDEVMAEADGLGRDTVAFWVTDATRPPELEGHLAALGAEAAETLSVLARSLDDLPDLDVPDDLEIRLVTDLTGMRDRETVSVGVFGGAMPSDDEFESALARLDPVEAPSWVAYRDDRPIGAGGMSYAGDAARLWGGSVLAEARGTGVYRALLDARLRAGRAAGRRFALVKGRVETSAPILTRAGFSAYAEERAHRLTRP